jgi:cobalt-zinc-cadmium efflux system outer membrane protein
VNARFLIAALVLLPDLGAPAAAGAAAAPEPPHADLAALLREAAAAPRLQAAGARADAALRSPSQAAALPDPVVTFGLANAGVDHLTLGEEPMSVMALTWSQDLPYRGKTSARAEVLARDAERAGLERDRLRLEIAAAVKSAYADLYRLDRRARLISETRALLAQAEDAARVRYETGSGAQESVLKAATERLRLDAEAERLAIDRAGAEGRLAAALGRTDGRPFGEAVDLPSVVVPADVDALVGEALERAPAIAALRAAVERQEATLRLARLDEKPDFMWSAGYGYRDTLDPMVTATFGVRLPVHRAARQTQAFEASRAELDGARRDLEDATARVAAAVRELLARAQRSERLAALLGQGVVPQAATTLESARASYAVGRTGFLDLIGDLRALLEARTGQAEAEADRVQALALIEPLVGREIVSAANQGEGELR